MRRQEQEGKNGVSRHATIITQILFFLCIWPNSLKRYPFTGIQKKNVEKKKEKRLKEMKEMYTFRTNETIDIEIAINSGDERRRRQYHDDHDIDDDDESL